MFKEMLIRGGIIVAGMIVTQAVIEKVEMASLKRNKVSTNMESKKKDVKITEEQLKQAFEKAIEMADELEAKDANHKL